jgi:hypothetical protein
MEESITPARQWHLSDLKDTRENVIDAVNGSAFVPSNAKALIVDAINTTHGDANLLSLSAHAQIFATQDKRRHHIINIHISEI